MSVEVRPTLATRAERVSGRAEQQAVTTAPGGRSRSLWALGIIALLALLGVVLPVAVASRYGAMGIPRSDDWSYLLTLFHWVETGRLTFNGWVSMTLIGQVVIAAPLAAAVGRSITTFQMLTAIIGLVGLLAVVWIGRQLVRPAWWAVFVAATIAVGPLWGPLAPTFMTDVPAFTFEMLSLAAAIVAFRRRPIALGPFAVSIALGFVGVSIRQYAIIPVIAIVLVAVAMLVADKDWRRLRIVAAISAIFFIASVALLMWWSGLPDSKSLSPKVPNLHSISSMLIRDAGFLRLGGLLLLPVVVLAGPINIAKRAWHASTNLTTLLTSLSAVWLVVMYIRVPRIPFVGNYVSRDGVLSRDVLAGNRPDVIPHALFNVLVVVGSISGILIVLAAVPFVLDLWRRVRARDFTPTDPSAAVLALAVVGFGAAYSLAITTGLPVYDRYALPLLPMVAFLLLRASKAEVLADAPPEPVEARAGTRRNVWAGVAITLLAVLGFAFSADSASFDGARWKVSEMATRKGFTPLQVGGGFEWLSYHRSHGPLFRWDFAKNRPVRLKTYTPPCVTVLINPNNSNKRVIAEVTSAAPTRKPVKVVAVRNRQPCKSGKEARTPTRTPGEPIATGSRESSGADDAPSTPQP